MCESVATVGIQCALEWGVRHCLIGGMAVAEGNLTLAKVTLQAAQESIGRALVAIGDVKDSKTGHPPGTFCADEVKDGMLDPDKTWGEDGTTPEGP